MRLTPFMDKSALNFFCFLEYAYSVRTLFRNCRGDVSQLRSEGMTVHLVYMLPRKSMIQPRGVETNKALHMNRENLKELVVERKVVLEKLDRLANEVANAMNVARAMVSIKCGNVLYSLGAHPAKYQALSARRYYADDTMCVETMLRNRLIAVENARLEKDYRRKKCVEEGLVVGYLGCPLRNLDGSAMGAICTITHAPRDWSLLETSYLRQVANTAQMLLNEEVTLSELDLLTRDVSQLDLIISTLSSTSTTPVSIYKQCGKLVFANRALAMLMPENSIRKFWAKERRRSFDTGQRAAHKTLDAWTTVYQTQGKLFSVHIYVSETGLIVCTWASGASQARPLSYRIQ